MFSAHSGGSLRAHTDDRSEQSGDFGFHPSTVGGLAPKAKGSDGDLQGVVVDRRPGSED